MKVGQVNRHRGRHWTLSQPFELCAIYLLIYESSVIKEVELNFDSANNKDIFNFSQLINRYLFLLI